MRLIFSKDRPAQLDLLLRSLDRYAPEEPTTVTVAMGPMEYHHGYRIVKQARPDVEWRDELLPGAFEAHLRNALRYTETVTFFCDDDVLYRPINGQPQAMLELSNVLTFSLRLGVQGIRPSYLVPTLDMPTWDWTKLDPHDHGYPGSVDGHTFRTADVLRMIEGQTIGDPLALETVLARRVGALAAERPLMACYREQALVGLDVNSVASSGGIRKSGMRWPQSAEELNQRFLAGERISLDALDFSRVDGCLVELPFVWEQAA